MNAGGSRYAGAVGDIGVDDLDLLECLLRIDLHEQLDGRAHALVERIVEAGLADRTDEGFDLTHAGVQRCKSLQHRLASDQEAARTLRDRGLPASILDVLPSLH